MAFDPTFIPKVKLLCSFGGRILPRPGDNALRYVGGQTRIIAVRRDVSYSEFTTKMAEALRGPIVIVKYQLPGEDLEALVSVLCPEDLDNMMEEYEKLVAATPDGSAKLRTFLFSPAELAAEAAAAAAQIDMSDDTGQRYMEAVNGTCGGVDGIIDMRRKDSFNSAASSNQNSEGTAGDGCFNEGMSSPTVASFDLPVDASSVGSGVTSVATGISAGNVLVSGIAAQHSFQQEQMQQGVSITQPYFESHQVQYVVPQQLGMTGHQNVNLVPLVPQHFVPGVPVNAAHNVAASQVDGSNSLPEKFETNPYVESTLQRPGDQGSKTFQQPLSQLPPLPPSLVQPPNVEGYGLKQIPVGLQPPQALKLDDCLMCQKALLHAHSDTCVQDHHVDSPGHLREANPLLYSLQSDDVLKQHISHLAAQGMRENPSVRNSEMFPADQLGGSIQPQVPRHEYLAFRPVNQYQQGASGIPNDPFPTNGSLIGNHMQPYVEDTYELHHHPQQQQQLLQTQTLLQPQYLVKKDNVATLGGMSNPLQPQQRWQTMHPSQYHIKQNVYNALGDPNIERGLNFQGTNPLSQYSGPEMPYDYAKPIDHRLEMLHLSSPEQFDDRKRMPEHVVVGTGYNAQHYMGQNTVVDNASVNCRVAPDGRYIRPVEQIPFNQMPPVAGYDCQLPSNFGLEASHTVPHEQTFGTLAGSYHISSECSDTSTVPLPDWKDDASRLRSQEIPGHFMAHPYPFSTGPTGQLDNFEELMTSESLLSYQEPSKVPVGLKLPPAPPSTVGKDSAASRETCLPNHFGGNGSNFVALLEEGNLHQTLNSDSSLGTVQPAKEEEHIKQQLQAVAEDVAASVLEPNATFSTAGVVEDHTPVSNEQVGDNHNSDGFIGVEIINNKQQDISNFGLHLDDLGHLQIIKNSDLEELSELGSGTFGTVYHGKWRGTDVAIKRINNRCFAGKQSEQERMRTDFWNEARKLADLHHPNVVAFYGVVVDGPSGSVATVTEYMVNGSLRQAWQKNDKVFDQRKRLLIAMDVAFGMEYLHAKRIIHFDLKSDNLLVNLRDPQRPICKVGDLGLSKVKCKTLISGGMRGTLPWMAPELLYGNDSLVSEKVDVYSFGVVMWELLTGEEPYGDLHYGAIIGGIVSNSLRPSVPDSCDPEWRSLMEQCWSAEPSERPTFTDIVNRLRNIAASLPHKGQIHGQK